jgi:hypothetical protein
VRRYKMDQGMLGTILWIAVGGMIGILFLPFILPLYERYVDWIDKVMKSD